MIRNTDCESVFLIITNLNTYISAGISIMKSLDLVLDSINDKKYKKSLIRISNNVNKGLLLSEALLEEVELFPKFICDMIRIGEESGTLEKVLEKLSYHLKRNNEVKKKIKKALIYPSILIISIVSSMVIYLFFILPKFSDLYSGIDENSSNIIYSIKKYINFVENNQYSTLIIITYLLIIILILVILVVYIKEKNYIKKLPVIRKYYESNIIFILQLIISSGVPIAKSFYILSENLTLVSLRKDFTNVKNRLWKGESLSEAMHSIDVISHVSHNFIYSGEESGKLEYSMNTLSFILEKELNEKIEIVLSVIEPIMIFFLGFLVLIMILIVFLPILEYMNYV